MEKALYDYSTISNYIIAKCNQDEKAITNLRLQKILYYVQGYFLRTYHESAFASDIEAWTYGPVVPDSYYDFCLNGAREIHLSQESIDENLNKIETHQHVRLLNNVIDACMNIPISQLVNKTHSERPWKDSKKDYSREKISKEIIQNYFSDNDPLNLK